MSHAYSLQFEPVARVGENIRILPDGIEGAGYYRVAFLEPIHPIVKDFGALAAGGDTGDQEVSELYMQDGELAQYRIILLDDVEVLIKQPATKERFSTKVGATRLTYQGQFIRPGSHEIFVFEDSPKVKFVVYNPGLAPIPTSRLMFIGFRYKLERLERPPDRWTAVTIGGV